MHEDVVDEGDLPSNVAGRLELHIKVQAEDACLEAAPQLQSTPVCTSSLSGVRFVFPLWMDGQSCSLVLYIHIYMQYNGQDWTNLVLESNTWYACPFLERDNTTVCCTQESRVHLSGHSSILLDNFVHLPKSKINNFFSLLLPQSNRVDMVLSFLYYFHIPTGWTWFYLEGYFFTYKKSGINNFFLHVLTWG